MVKVAEKDDTIGGIGQGGGGAKCNMIGIAITPSHRRHHRPSCKSVKVWQGESVKVKKLKVKMWKLWSRVAKVWKCEVWNFNPTLLSDQPAELYKIVKGFPAVAILQLWHPLTCDVTSFSMMLGHFAGRCLAWSNWSNIYCKTFCQLCPSCYCDILTRHGPDDIILMAQSNCLICFETHPQSIPRSRYMTPYLSRQKSECVSIWIFILVKPIFLHSPFPT